MSQVQNNVLHTIVQPLVYISLAYVAGSKRFIHYFPGGSRCGIGMATLAGLGAVWTSTHMNQLESETPYHSTLRVATSLALGTIGTHLVSRVFPARVSLNLEAAGRWLAVESCVTIMFAGLSHWVSASTPSEPRIKHPVRSHVADNYTDFSESPDRFKAVNVEEQRECIKKWFDQDVPPFSLKGIAFETCPIELASHSFNEFTEHQVQWLTEIHCQSHPFSPQHAVALYIARRQHNLPPVEEVMTSADHIQAFKELHQENVLRDVCMEQPLKLVLLDEAIRTQIVDTLKSAKLPDMHYVFVNEESAWKACGTLSEYLKPEEQLTRLIGLEEYGVLYNFQQAITHPECIQRLEHVPGALQRVYEIFKSKPLALSCLPDAIVGLLKERFKQQEWDVIPDSVDYLSHVSSGEIQALDLHSIWSWLQFFNKDPSNRELLGLVKLPLFCARFVAISRLNESHAQRKSALAAFNFEISQYLQASQETFSKLKQQYEVYQQSEQDWESASLETRQHALVEFYDAGFPAFTYLKDSWYLTALPIPDTPSTLSSEQQSWFVTVLRQLTVEAIQDLAAEVIPIAIHCVHNVRDPELSSERQLHYLVTFWRRGFKTNEQVRDGLQQHYQTLFSHPLSFRSLDSQLQHTLSDIFQEMECMAIPSVEELIQELDIAKIIGSDENSAGYWLHILTYDKEQWDGLILDHQIAFLVLFNRHFEHSEFVSRTLEQFHAFFIAHPVALRGLNPEVQEPLCQVFATMQCAEIPSIEMLIEQLPGEEILKLNETHADHWNHLLSSNYNVWKRFDYTRQLAFHIVFDRYHLDKCWVWDLTAEAIDEIVNTERVLKWYHTLFQHSPEDFRRVPQAERERLQNLFEQEGLAQLPCDI